MKILVAYESTEICERIKDHLSDIPIAEVFWRDSHSDLWFEEVKDNWPDVVILDAESGAINGIAVMKRMKRLDQPPVVIMTSNVPYRQYKSECLKQGADYFFHLPDEIDQMSRTIHALANVVCIE
jgi:DNA-binding response OmpR family regulator